MDEELLIKVYFPIKGWVSFDKSHLSQFIHLGCQKGLAPKRYGFYPRDCGPTILHYAYR